jgi:hypothetical protein
MSVAEDSRSEEPAEQPGAFGPFTGANAWTGSTLNADAGVVTLAADCLAEIDQTLGVLKANPLPVLRLSPDDVEMPACAATMTSVRWELRSFTQCVSVKIFLICSRCFVVLALQTRTYDPVACSWTLLPSSGQLSIVVLAIF